MARTSQHATKKYGPKASGKVARTLHEWKRGTLKSGSGGKVTSRAQAIAIGLSQARRKGYKVPPSPSSSSRHATMSDDAKVRAYLSHMRAGAEIDGWGMARALKIEPLVASHALKRAVKAGLAVTSDGRWFGPARGQHGQAHARKKTPAQLNREIAEALAPGQTGQLKVKDRYSGGHAWLTVRDGRVVGAMGSDPKRYVGMSLDEARHHARYGGSKSKGTRSGHATKQGAGSALFAVEIDRSAFDTKRDLPPDAHWRADLGHLAETELARGRSYRRPKDARYAVLEWTGYRGAVGRLLDWLEGAEGITRYAEIFE